MTGFAGVYKYVDYIEPSFLCCKPLRATLKTEACAKRYRLANTLTMSMANSVEEHYELEGSPCRKCKTGQANAEALLPITRRDDIRAKSGLGQKACLDCKEGFLPTNRTHKRCSPCGKVRYKRIKAASDKKRPHRSRGPKNAAN
jgi:hypothetical protein